MNPEEPSEELLSRKGFLQQGWKAILSQVAESLPDFSTAAPGGEAGQVLLRPPGAVQEETFLKTCQPFCQECRMVCPRDSIQQDMWGFPIIDPAASPCVMCLDVPCTPACPTEALTLLNDPRQITLGTAVIEVTACTAYQGSGCCTCYDTCPIPNDAIQMIEGLPQIVPEQCTGCGVCVHHCPTPSAISIRPIQQ